jgi:flagellar biogenesis protein FliO
MRSLITTMAAVLAGFFAFVETAAAKSGAYNAGFIFGRVILLVLVVAAIVWIVRRIRRSSSDTV